MAIAKLGPIVQALSGSVGGTNFAQGQHNTIVRKRQRYKLSKTPDQINQATAFKGAIAAWHALSSPQRLQWNRVAATVTFQNSLSIPINLSGFQLFLKFHGREWIGSPPATSNPPDPVASQPALLSFPSSKAGVYFYINVYNPLLSGYTACRVEVARSFSQIEPKSFRNFRHVDDIALNQTGYDALSEVAQSLGYPQVGEWVAMRVRLTYQGNLLSAPVTTTVQTIA